MKPLLLGERSNPLKSWMGDAKRREEAVISVHKALQHSVGNWVSSFIYVVVFPFSLLSPPSFGIERCNPGTASPCTLAKWPERIQRPEGSWMNAFDKTNAFHGSWIEIRSGEKSMRRGLVLSSLTWCIASSTGCTIPGRHLCRSLTLASKWINMKVKVRVIWVD